MDVTKSNDPFRPDSLAEKVEGDDEPRVSRAEMYRQIEVDEARAQREELIGPLAELLEEAGVDPDHRPAVDEPPAEDDEAPEEPEEPAEEPAAEPVAEKPTRARRSARGTRGAKGKG